LSRFQAPPSQPRQFQSLRSKLLAAVAAVALSLAAPAAAQVVVIDPSNLAQAVEQVRHALTQIRVLTDQLNQQARMLAQSPYDHTAELRAALDDLNSLADDVRGIRADAQTLAAQLAELYPRDLSARSLVDMAGDADRRISATQDTVEDSLRIAAELEARRGGAAGRMQGALAAARGAEGQTSAIQATTQAIGALSEQVSALETLLAAQLRMAGAAQADAAARAAAARETRRRLYAREPAAPPPPSFDPLPAARH
jgi:P-type conjugative transfer protein TrbJ